MIINPKIFVQQNNIYKNKKNKVTLPYSDELIFYKMLDQYLESGKAVEITFPHEKLTEDSDLHKRLACCLNGQEFFEQMVDLAKTALEVYQNFATKNIFGLWQINNKLTQKVIYQAYTVECQYNHEIESYFLLLEPRGEGTDSKSWMFFS